MRTTHRSKWHRRLLLVVLSALLLAIASATYAQNDSGDMANRDVTQADSQTGEIVPTNPPSDDPVVDNADGEIIPPPPKAPNPEPTPEDISDTDAAFEIPTFRDDFDGVTARGSWMINSWQYNNNLNNTVLTTNLPSAVATIANFSQSDFVLNARLLVEPNNTANITFRNNYSVLLNSTGSTRLFVGDQAVDSYVMTGGSNLNATWFDVQLTVAGNRIGVTVNGVPTIDYTTDVIAATSPISFVTGNNNVGRVSLDNVLVEAIVDTSSVEIAPVAERENDFAASNRGAPAPLPNNLDLSAPNAPDGRDGETTLSEGLTDALTLGVDEELVALAKLENLGYMINSDRQIFVEVHPDNVNAMDAITETIVEMGGSIVSSNDEFAEAFVTLATLRDLSDDATITRIEKPISATSTSYDIAAMPFAPAGNVVTEGFDMAGANNWHLAGTTGAGVTIGIIDTGFSGDVSTSEYACLTERRGSIGFGDSGLNLVEVVCDIAPSATVYTYGALSYTSFYDAVESARQDAVDIMIIGLDLKASVTPGDGRGLGDRTDPYIALEDAANEGIAIFASAGAGGTSTIPADTSNINVLTEVSRYVSFSVPQAVDSTVTLDFTASVGDEIHISWNDWRGLGETNLSNIEDFTISVRNPAGNLVTEIEGNPYEAADFRQVQTQNPSVVFTIPGDVTACAADANNRSSCDFQLEIVRAKGDSDVIMQVQLFPVAFERIFGENPFREAQTAGVTFTSITGATAATNAGTLARPADSPDVIAVGGVCASENGNYAAVPGTSVGPVFGSNGQLPTVGAAPFDRADVKPEVVSATHVSTSIVGVTNANACDGTVQGSDNAGGVRGTAISAAHVGGMAALLQSNPSMSSRFNRTTIGVDELLNYLQGHTVELPLTDPNSYDMRHGAGFTTLGFPNYDLDGAINTLFVPDELTCAGQTVFVGQKRLNGVPNGTQEQPFIHIADGIAAAGRDGCVVVMPGEYPTPILIRGSFGGDISIHALDDVTSVNFPESVIQVNGQYIQGTYTSNDGYDTSSGTVQPRFLQNAGVYVMNTTGTKISGFSFSPVTPFNTSATPRQGVLLRNTSSGQILNSRFGQATISGETFDGWNNTGATPILGIGTDGTLVQGNEFVGNTAGYFDNTFSGGSNDDVSTPTAVFVDATTNPVVFRNNLVEGNTAIQTDDAPRLWSTLLYSLNSDIDIVGNTFINNDAATLINVVTKNAAATDAARITSNVFLNNRLDATILGSNAVHGPLVHAYFVPSLTFMSNTVVTNTLNDSTFAGVIGRGDRDSTVTNSQQNGSLSGAQPIDFYLNLVYNNTGMSLGPLVDPSINFSACNALGGGTNNGTRANWWHTASTGGFGKCNTAMNNATNLTRTPVDPNAPDLIGASPNGNLDPLTDIEYYALNFFDRVNYSEGMDYSAITGSQVNYGGVGTTPYPFNVDVTGDDRVEDVENWQQGNTTDNGTVLYDIGAFEFDTLDIVDSEYVANAIEDTNNNIISIDMRDVVRGGIGNLNYTITKAPLNYGTQCGPEFTDANNGIVVNNNDILYCSPRDFYTTPLTPDVQLDFEFRATDASGFEVICERDPDNPANDCFVTIRIVSDESVGDPDAPLTAVIGDDNPVGDIFRVTADIGSTVEVKLRPYVDYNLSADTLPDNFIYSERNNPEYLADNGRFMAQYPFNYQLGQPTGDINILVDVTRTGSTLRIELSETGTGEAVIPYTVTDLGGNEVTNFLNVRAISRVPVNPGVYDDSSFAFDYYNGTDINNDGNWRPVTSATNINGTLHTTNRANDTATFGFRGTGFVLYMQGERLGGFWDLTIDDLPLDTWTASDGVFTATSSADPTGFTCVSSSTALDGATRRLTNRSLTSQAYTVSCNQNSYTAGDELVHIVDISNRGGNALSVDAFGIVTDPNNTAKGPFTPGHHDVDEGEVRAIFGNGWNEVSNFRYSKQIAYRANNANAADVSFTFTGGTGVAIGTVLDNSPSTYTICITDVDNVGSNPTTCQDFTNKPNSAFQRTTPYAYRTFMGYDPIRTYRVTISLNTVGNNGMIIDEIVVFNPTESPASLLSAQAEAGDWDKFVLANGIDNTWELNSLYPLANNGDAAQIKTFMTGIGLVPKVGPIVSVEVDPNVDTLYWQYGYILPSTQTLICVDRALGTGTDATNAHGNCIQVNLRNGSYTRINADGSNGSGGTMEVVDNTLEIREGAFRTAWQNTTKHTIEIYSLIDEQISVDRFLAVGRGVPLSEGFYEEYINSVNYLLPDGSNATIRKAFNSLTSNYTGDFTQVTGSGAFLDTGRSVMYTNDVGNIINFNIEGTGFAPHVRMWRDAGAMRVCWLPYTDAVPAALAVLANGTCQTFDTESLAPMWDTQFRILGLARGKYGVSIEFLGDNFLPKTSNFRPAALYFDGITVYNDDLTVQEPGIDNITLNQLNVGVEYEGNYDNRFLDSYFAYYGDAWRHVSSGNAGNFSGNNYDFVNVRAGGSMVAFRVNDANAVRLERALSIVNSDFYFCAAEEQDVNGNTVLDRFCSPVDNDGFGFGNEIVIHLNESGLAGDYLITLTAYGYTNFYFDSVTPLNFNEPLIAGLYDDNHPGIVYQRGGDNLVLNGDMELSNGPANYWTRYGGSGSSSPTNNPRYTNLTSREVRNNAGDSGIQSLPFSLEGGYTYTALGRVRKSSGGAIRMELVSNGTPVAEYTIQSTNAGGRWVTLRDSFYLPEGTNYNNVRLRFSSSNAATYYVDDVHLMRGGQWQTIVSRSYYNGYGTAISTHGAQASFLMTGTGFSIGTYLGREAGQMEICYLSYVNTVPTDGEVVTNGDCVTFENEVSIPNYGLRTVSGLPSATYKVIVRDKEDGNSVTAFNANTPRLQIYALPRTVIDYVQVYDQTPPSITQAGTYAENAQFGGEQGLALVPGNDWGLITGPTASAYSNNRFLSVVDNFGNSSRAAVGQTAMMNIRIPANEEAVVTLDIQDGGFLDSNLLLVCAGGIDGSIEQRPNKSFTIVDGDGTQECLVTAAMRSNDTLTFDSADLSQLANNTVNPVDRIVLFQPVNPGQFQIDGYEITFGNILAPGYYEETVSSTIVQRSGEWTPIDDAMFNGGSAITGTDGSRLDFAFSGTGVSIVSAYEINQGGMLTLNVTSADGTIVATQQLDVQAGFNDVGSAVTVAGLPEGDYTATLTVTGGDGVVDSITVYDTLKQLGSLYDDAQVNAEGELLLTYGPRPESWDVRTGTNADNALNNTLHVARKEGAVASFEIGATANDASGIVLYFDSSMTTAETVEVCYRDANNPSDVLDCTDVAVDSGVSQSVSAPTAGRYFVTVRNTGRNQVFALDAVQVLEGQLVEGIYTASDIDAVANYSDGAGVDGDTIALPSNGTVSFEMSGIGLSFIVANATENQTYNLSVNDGDTNIINSDLNTSTVSSLADDRALTMMGLHASNGNIRDLTVTLTNTSDATINIREVHILGDNDTLMIRDGQRYENDAPQLRYLPFGSFVNTNDKTSRASGFTQTETSTQGATAYFEFSNIGNSQTGFEYARQQDSLSFGAVEICYGAIGRDTLASAQSNNQCATVDNTQTDAYQSVYSVTPAENLCDDGCWATIRNLDGSTATLDYVTLFNVTTFLDEGIYQQGNAEITYSNPFGIQGNWTDVNDLRASGGSVKRFVVQNNVGLTDYNGPVASFIINGTGATVYFTAERNADAVRICFTPYTGTQTATDALKDQCQTFDNENPFKVNTLGRTVGGLPPGEYVFAVQMLSDNESPAPHLSFARPLRIEVDAVEVHGLTDADWTSLNTLSPGRRYETNYKSRNILNDFVYYGDAWTTTSGPAALNYSNQDYDRTRRGGSGITFHAQNGDAVILYTDLRFGYSEIRICATPVDSSLSETAGDVMCRDYNVDGFDSQSPQVFQLAPFGQSPVANYSVTITSLEQAFFTLDAVEVVNTGVLQAGGIYQTDHPSIHYPSGYEEYIVNGSMEYSKNWPAVGGGVSRQFTGDQRFDGSTSLLVNVASGNRGSGVESEAFALTKPGFYTAMARVRVTSGSFRMRLVQGNQTQSILEFPEGTVGNTGGEWFNFTVDFTVPQGVTYGPYDNTAASGLKLQLVSDISGNNSRAYIDDVKLVYGGRWSQATSPLYNNGNAYVSTTDGATMYFAFEGTGFQLGQLLDRDGGEMEVCYDDDALFDEDRETNGNQSCFVYQNENIFPVYQGSRTITGLPYGTYYVRIHEVENGQTTLNRFDTNDTRLRFFSTGELKLDYIRIFDQNDRTVTPSGYYNEDATDSNGNPYLQLYPRTGWTQVTGPAATRFTEGSYYSVADSNGLASLLTIGQAALTYVDVPESGESTVIFYNGRASFANADAILICAGDSMSGEIVFDGEYSVSTEGSPGDCVIRDGDSDKFIVTERDLAALGTPGVTRVSVSNLSTGFFFIDGFQVITGSTLSAGIYDNTLPDSLLDFDTLNQELPNNSFNCNQNARWCLVRDPLSYQGNVYKTRQLDATLNFDFNGTGFSIITKPSFLGVDFRVCYTVTPIDGSQPQFPTRQQTINQQGNFIWDNTTQNLDTGGVWCDVFTTNTSPIAANPWGARNDGRTNPSIGWQFGFAYYGLPNGNYSVEVRHVDTTLRTGAANSLDIDAVAVFNNRRLLPVIGEGLYDDTDTRISYEPSPMWTEPTSFYGPRFGPYGRSEHTSNKAGSIAQMRIVGNALTLYQTTDAFASRDMRICMLVTDATIHCAPEANSFARGVQDQTGLPAYALSRELASFRQNSFVRTYFNPILFYGLGEGEHEIIIENRNHNGVASIDAIEVHD